MNNQHEDLIASSTTDGLPVAPSMGPSLEQLTHIRPSPLNSRTVLVSFVSILIALAASFIAVGLIKLIGFFTNLFFYGRLSLDFVSPAGNHLGYFVIAIPIIGGLIVGIMARYGSQAIRGHGIPEAMERVLAHESRIPKRMTVLKPLSAAISIGTGGPFGAEGPIIATGGALGSLTGQIFSFTAEERKKLLAAGAAAGMTATFGSPVSAVMLAVELLLFEYRPRSLIPVALAAATAAAVRISLEGSQAVFPMPDVSSVSTSGLLFYVLTGALLGVVSVFVNQSVYAVEDFFEKLPIHWMWWPAIGGLAVGIIGFFEPLTMGVGYDNIQRILSGNETMLFLLGFCALKFLSWSLSLGSGTSGGTLAPLFTVGGALGSSLGLFGARFLPSAGIHPGLAGLVGMAALFTGCSRAFFASVIFAFETTRQTNAILPLLGSCALSYMISSLLMKESIMTEKIARRGIRVPSDFASDYLDRIPVEECATGDVLFLESKMTIAQARSRILDRKKKYQGFPVVNGDFSLLGILMREEIFSKKTKATVKLETLIQTTPFCVFSDNSLREAIDCMAVNQIGRLPVLSRQDGKLHGIITRSDILAAYHRATHDGHIVQPGLVARMKR